jgi:ABC-2 type transport system ATP-binding protein
MIRVHELAKTFRRANGEIVRALDCISMEAPDSALTALVGPDGAGKTTLIRLIAGLLRADSGALDVLGIDVAARPQAVQDRVGYMPQRFGLYEDLSVIENLNLYADLHGVPAAERGQRYRELMEMTALGPFLHRLAGQLSGGMKQKLGLACCLVRSPDLLLLDEPTVGVDPLSRQELWDIVRHLVDEQHLTVLLSTAYLDEAERCSHVLVLHQGRVLAHGAPSSVRALANGRTFFEDPPAGQPARSLQARLLGEPGIVDAVPEGGRVRVVHENETSGEEPAPPRFEDGFMILLRRTVPQPVGGALAPASAAPLPPRADVVVAVHDLVRKFGAFTAVDHVSFHVRRGEIFGLLGPNGAGKTTTFRMLCGLLTPTAGTLRVAGVDLLSAPASARRRVGYVAQKFSLYGSLSVMENLTFFASAYGVRGSRQRERLEWALREFELGPMARLPSAELPGGYKQRLAMAASLLHEPEILFLDEPTSGADPLARREFWRRITAFAERGMTVIVTTHFMEEAEYCDRVVILDAGRILAEGTPAAVRGARPTMEDAFVEIVRRSRAA